MKTAPVAKAKAKAPKKRAITAGAAAATTPASTSEPPLPYPDGFIGKYMRRNAASFMEANECFESAPVLASQTFEVRFREDGSTWRVVIGSEPDACFHAPAVYIRAEKGWTRVPHWDIEYSPASSAMAWLLAVHAQWTTVQRDKAAAVAAAKSSADGDGVEESKGPR